MSEHSAEKDARDVIAAALADHRETFEDTDLPTEYHGYADAVLAALAAHGYRVTSPGKDQAR